MLSEKNSTAHIYSEQLAIEIESGIGTFRLPRVKESSES